MAMNEAKRRMIEYQVSQLEPEQIEAFLKNACEANFEPGLSLAALEALVAKCSPAALALLQQRLTERGSTAGLARIQAILDNDTCPLNCGTAAVPRKEVAQRLRS